MTDVRLVDVSIRDGNQSLWGATGLNSAQILEIAPTIERLGFQAIDFTSSTHMAVAVRYAKDDPWERIRLMHQACPTTPLQYITTGMRFISWEVSDPEFMRLVYRRLVANGLERFIVLDPMHDLEGFLSAACCIKEEGGRDVMGALTYTVSAVHDDDFYANLAAAFASSPHIDRVYLKDPAGMLLPDRARTLIPAIAAKLNGKPFELHSHCTIGLSPLTYMMAVDLGVTTLHVAAGPLANGTSLPSATRIVANLRELGHRVDIDDRALERMDDYFIRLADAEGLPHGSPQEFDAAFLRHQMPGGAVTTFKRQLKEMKQEHRWPALIEEVPRVRAELGYPIMVTPFPQMVCTQALLNVVGSARYATVPDEIIRYVLGRFGRPTAPVDPAILDRVLSTPRAKEIQAEPPPRSLKELRKQFPASMSDDEFLLRAVMPAEQVDAMIAKGPTTRHYNPDARPLLALLKELKQKPDVSQFVVEKPNFRVTLKSRRGNGATAHG
jgi:oxaloacetate decarboxylase alpha subunit